MKYKDIVDVVNAADVIVIMYDIDVEDGVMNDVDATNIVDVTWHVDDVDDVDDTECAAGDFYDVYNVRAN